MSKVSLQELNELMLAGFKDMLSSEGIFKDREFCITSFAKDGKGSYVSMLIDVASSLGFNFSVPHVRMQDFNKIVFEGIAKKLALRIVVNAKKQKPQRFDWNQTPLRAKGRVTIYEGCINFPGAKGKLHLLSWSRIILK